MLLEFISRMCMLQSRGVAFSVGLSSPADQWTKTEQKGRVAANYVSSAMGRAGGEDDASSAALELCATPSVSVSSQAAKIKMLRHGSAHGSDRVSELSEKIALKMFF